MNRKILFAIILIIIVILIIVVTLMFTSINNKDNTEFKNDVISNETILNENTKVLVVYFSIPETDSPNNMTIEEENSTVVIDGNVFGNTQYVAMLISEKTGGDIYRIEPKEAYTTNHEDLVAQAKEEQNNNARPEIEDEIENFEDYDVIFVGYPNWWGDMPMILYTFLEKYNFDGKIIIPFNIHGGSGLSNTVRTITNKLPNATVIQNAFTMSRNNMEQVSEKIESWLKEINMIK